MKYWKAIILGLVQGLTEFLPVSSSGHLMLLAELGIGEKALFFSIMLHVATLFSVCLFYRKRIYRLIRHPLQKENKYIIIATLPTVVFAIIVRLFFNEIGPSLLPFGFMISAVFLTLGSLNWGKGKKMDDISAFIVGVAQGIATIGGCCKKMDDISAFIVGVAQGIATIGGCSRSGSVVSTQLILGIDRETAGDFAFMLSIPIILASIAGECIAFKGYIGVETMPLILAMIVAFLSGLLAIKVFLQILKNGRLLPFAIYAFVLSIVSFYIIY